MFGLRGAPGSTIAHATSYWVGKHSTRVFAEKVDIVCGIGYDRYTEGDPAFRFHHIPKVVTNLGVFDFGGPGRTMRAVTLHPVSRPRRSRRTRASRWPVWPRRASRATRPRRSCA